MQYTLLQLIQIILSAMDSDEVNNYNDTVESLQVATLLRSVFYDIATEIDLPEQQVLFELLASGDNLKPTLMTVPGNVKTLNWIKYNNILTLETTPNYQPVDRITFEDFIVRQQSLRDDSSDTGSMSFTSNGETFEVLYRTNKMPNYYCQVGTSTLLFDSFDEVEDTTLQKSKTMCEGLVFPTFTLSNSFVPPLNAGQFAYYLNKAKERAFSELKQVANVEAAREARVQRTAVMRQKDRVDKAPGIYQAPRYGRS